MFSCYPSRLHVYPHPPPTTTQNNNAKTRKNKKQQQVRDWYVESFKNLRSFPAIRDSSDELKFTDLLKQIYQRHQVSSRVATGGECWGWDA